MQQQQQRDLKPLILNICFTKQKYQIKSAVSANILCFIFPTAIFFAFSLYLAGHKMMELFT